MKIGEILFALIILLAITFMYSSLTKKESFGMSPGTMDQLASTRAENYIMVPV
jgi:hypothetical protein